ncbi:MAG: alpha/beta hydrolase [Cyanobacteria bacterium P01_F01_bin.86]
MLTLCSRPVYTRTLPRLLQTMAMSLGAGLIATLPARSAEKIYFDYDPFGRSLPVSSLEAFIESGTIDADLAPYLDLVPPDQLQEFQQGLSTSLASLSSEIPAEASDPFALSQWLYSPIGELVLDGVGQLIQTENRHNGQHAIRAAIILAAADPDGLSLINLIRHYPTDGIRLDLREILTLYRTVSTNIETTDRLVNVAAQISAAAAAADPVLDYSTLPVLAAVDPLQVTQRSLVLQDEQRDRTYPVDLYLPQNLSAIQGPIPVMVFSHG